MDKVQSGQVQLASRLGGRRALGPRAEFRLGTSALLGLALGRSLGRAFVLGMGGLDGCGGWEGGRFGVAAVRAETGLSVRGGGGDDMAPRPSSGLHVKPSDVQTGSLSGVPSWSSWASCHRASAMASSFALSSSALVRKPLKVASFANLSPRAVPDPQPCVMDFRRSAAPAITSLIFWLRDTALPPNLCPEFFWSVLRLSADALACRLSSCLGMRPPPRRWPWERKPSPVYPLNLRSSYSSRSWFHSLWKFSS